LADDEVESLGLLAEDLFCADGGADEEVVGEGVFQGGR
jgi:hypothetical protein